MKKISFSIALFLLGNCSLFSQKNTRFNPIIPDNLADPSLAYFNDTFYMYATTDVDQGLAQGGPPVVWRSTDFLHWWFDGILETGMDWNKSYSFKDKEGKERNGYFRYWAPGKPIERNGKYFLFPTIVTPDNRMGTYVMEAHHPAGPFHFLDGKTISMPAAETDAQPIVPDIDGEPFVDEDGRTYIPWRRKFAVEVGDDLRTQVGEVVTIRTKHQGYSEGPGIFKRNGIYYYFYTISGHASYANAYMMSKEGPLKGYQNPEGKNVFIRSDTATGVWGPGHGNIFKVPGKDEYLFLYLEYGEGGTTRQIFANRMTFNPDGTIQPMKPDFKGVGPLKANVRKKASLPEEAIITASSTRSSRTVKGDIAPDPDLALENKNLPTLHVTRIADYTASHIADGSYGTRWRADPQDADPWVQIDFGKKRKIRSLEMYFVFPAYGHSWYIEKSDNGKDWEKCCEEKGLAVRSPHVAEGIGKARYVRIHVKKGEPGIWEVRVR